MWPRRISRNKSASSGQDFSTRNGELLLRKQISFSQSGRSNPIRTFTLSELEEATNNFDHLRGLGLHGHFSVHYGGIVDDRKVVVKYIRGNPGGDFQDQLAEALVTEIVILSSIRHRNMVKLVGCCLETRVPALVYEFVPRRDLAHNLERWRLECPQPWSTRLQIALDVADALSYLHSRSSGPILHRNIHPESILLDEDCNAKLCGFGYSVPLPLNKTQVEDGAYRYVDPVHHTTGIFTRKDITEKADVYSFGIILIELLTGERLPRYLSREGREIILGLIAQGENRQEPPVNEMESAVAGEAMTEQQLALEEACLAILVADASAPGDAEERTEQYRAFAKLALECVRPRLLERPTMKEVVLELRRIRSTVVLP